MAIPIEQLRNLCKTQSKNWYIVSDMKVLFHDLMFLKSYILGDTNCRILVPSKIYDKIAEMSSYDPKGLPGIAYEQITLLEKMMRFVKFGFSAQSDDSGDDDDDELITCCLMMAEHDMHAILVTKSVGLQTQAQIKGICAYNIDYIKDPTTEIFSHPSTSRYNPLQRQEPYHCIRYSSSQPPPVEVSAMHRPKPVGQHSDGSNRRAYQTSNNQVQNSNIPLAQNQPHSSRHTPNQLPFNNAASSNLPSYGYPYGPRYAPVHSEQLNYNNLNQHYANPNQYYNVPNNSNQLFFYNENQLYNVHPNPLQYGVVPNMGTVPYQYFNENPHLYQVPSQPYYGYNSTGNGNDWNRMPYTSNWGWNPYQ